MRGLEVTQKYPVAAAASISKYPRNGPGTVSSAPFRTAQRASVSTPLHIYGQYKYPPSFALSTLQTASVTNSQRARPKAPISAVTTAAGKAQSTSVLAETMPA